MSKCLATEEKTCRGSDRVYLRAGQSDKQAKLAAFRDISKHTKAQVTVYKYGKNKYGFDRWNVGGEHLLSLNNFCKRFIKIQDEDCL